MLSFHFLPRLIQERAGREKPERLLLSLGGGRCAPVLRVHGSDDPRFGSAREELHIVLLRIRIASCLYSRPLCGMATGWIFHFVKIKYDGSCNVNR